MSQPSDAPTANDLFQAAVGRHRAGDLAGAVDLYRRAIALEPRHAFAHGNLGAALRGLGQAAAAIASYDAALALRPDYTDALSNRGNALQDLQRFDAALASFQAALAQKPDDPVIRNNIGALLLRLDDPAAALSHIDAAIARQPDHATAHFNRGAALRALNRTDEAVLAYDRAIALQPTYVEALVNRGDALLALGRLDAARTSLDQAVALKPDEVGARYNRGNLLLELGEVDAALAEFDAAIALDPGHETARWNRGITRLRHGDFARGWEDYDRRWALPAHVEVSSGLVTPALRERLDLNLRPEDLVGRRVLVVSEEAIGDVVMFASLLPDLLAVAGQVTLLCERRLHRLMAGSFPHLALLGPRDAIALADHDLILAIGSLAPLYRRSAEAFPRVAYLSASEATRGHWRDWLGPRTTRLRIGLSWRGGTALTGGMRRSIPLAELAPLLDRPDCEVVSLQYGDHAAEIAAVNDSLVRPLRTVPTGAIEDFEDLAGLVQSLDLVVSVQTALVHVAGAVGAPCLAMVPAQTSWRYGTGAKTMPWYGSVRLFRKADDQPWSTVIDAVTDQLGG